MFIRCAEVVVVRCAAEKLRRLQGALVLEGRPAARGPLRPPPPDQSRRSGARVHLLGTASVHGAPSARRRQGGGGFVALRAHAERARRDAGTDVLMIGQIPVRAHMSRSSPRCSARTSWPLSRDSMNLSHADSVRDSTEEAGFVQVPGVCQPCVGSVGRLAQRYQLHHRGIFTCKITSVIRVLVSTVCIFI